MAKKLFAVFVMCIIVVAALHIGEAQAEDDEDSQQYKDCFNNCLKECENENNNGRTHCEMMCDNDCGDKESAAKLEKIHDRRR